MKTFIWGFIIGAAASSWMKEKIEGAEARMAAMWEVEPIG